MEALAGRTIRIESSFSSFRGNVSGFCLRTQRRVCRGAEVFAVMTMKSQVGKFLLVMGVAIGLLIVPGIAPTFAQSAPDQLLFGPQQYLRTTGPPNEYTDTITVPASVGAPFQLHIVNGEANGQNRISSAWIKINGVQVAGPSDFGQNVAVVDKTITLNSGTNMLYVKVASSPGSYLTISALGTKILPTPASLTPNPLTLTVGATGTLTATLSPAPTTTGILSVTSSNPAAATVPASVNVAIGQTSVPIPVTAVGAGSTQVTVSLNGGSASATVQVNAAAPTITSLAPPTLTITQGASGTLTVTISAAQPTATTVTLISSASGIASVPGTVTIPAGQTTAPIPVSANTPGTAQITASLNGTSAASLVTVTAALPTVVSLLPLTNPVNLGGSVTLMVTISAAQPTDTTIPLSASPGGVVTVPPSVTVLANQTTATFSVGTVALGTALVTASLNGTSASASVQVTPPPPVLANFAPAVQTIAVGATTTFTVTLNAAQTTATVVTVSVDAGSILQVPASVTVPQNQISATFTVTGLAVGDATVTATVGSSSRTALVHVVPPPPVAVSLLPPAQAIQQGANGTLTFTLTPTQLVNTTIALTNSNATVLQVPASVTVPAGQTSAPIIVTGLVPGGPVTISATLGGVTVSATVTVTPPPTLITGITPATLSLPKGKPGTLRVTVSPAPTVATNVTLASSDTSHVVVPAMVTVPAGALFADFVVTTPGEGSAVVTASLNGSSATATVTVTPAEVVLLTLSPQNPSLFIGESQPFTVTGTYTDGTTQDLTTTVTWTSSDGTKATITSGGVAAALAVGTTTITASVTNPSGPPAITASTTLTVLTPPPMQLIPSTASLQVGENVSLTLDAGAPAGTGGLTVTLSSTGSGSITHPATVTVLEGETQIPFTVTGATAGSVTLTASATGRQSATATLAVTPGVPSITSFSPTSGAIGTTVTITGTSFHTVASENTVKFNGTTAIITSVNSTGTQIVTTVPQGATTGPITVTTSVGTATSATNFTVTLSQNFSLSAAPALTTVVQGGQGSYVLAVTPVGSFTGLVTLMVTGLPSGVTATFSSPTLTMGQTAYLTLTASGAVPPGAIGLTLTGTAPLQTGPSTQTIPLTLTVLASGGQTAVSGQFLSTADNKPIPNVQVNLGILQAVSDTAGNFLLQNAPSGLQQLMVSGSFPTGGFGYAVDVTLPAGQTTALPTLWVTPQPPETDFVTINNAAADQTITNPKFPGLSMTLPAGAIIVGWDNVPKTKIALERLELDRIGIPPPPGPTTAAYQAFFGTPMGGFLTPAGTKLPVTAPNDLDLDPGEKAELWAFDASPLGGPAGWRKLGDATVSADGATLVTDPGVGIERFCYKCNIICIIRKLFGLDNPPPQGESGGDPVDLSTGRFMAQKTDLVLPGRLPLTLSRTFNAQDPYGGTAAVSLGLGQGWLLSVDVSLLPLPGGQVFRLILPGNSRLDLVQQPDGTYRNATHPFLSGAVLTGTGIKTLRFKDGTTWKFAPFIQGIEFLVEQADRYGNKITIARAGIRGLPVSITDAGGRVTNFTTFSEKIIQILDPLGRTIHYTYGANERLATVTDTEGGITRYTYDAANNLTEIVDPRGIAYLRNFYGASGRVVRQILADGGEWRFRYQVAGAAITGPGCTQTPGVVVFPPGACPSEESWDTVQAGYAFTGGTVTATTVIDPRSQSATTRFNNARLPIAKADGVGQTTTQTRNAGNQVTASTDPLGRVTKSEYDAPGNVTKITDPDNHMTQFEYEPTFNRVKKITDALTQITEFTYDATGNLLTTKDPLTHVTTIAYNAFGQPISVQGPIPAEPPTTFAYDANGNLVTTTDPVGNVTQRAYDVVNRLTSLTDPRGLVTQFRYDNLNRVTEIADARQGLTRFSYDPNGNLLTVQDVKNQTTTYTYDSLDRLATRKDALNRQESYQYDPAGNLTTFTDRKNQVTTFTYDSLNRRIGASYADGSSTAFIYDAVGRLTKATDSVVGAIEFVYDNLNRLSKEISAQGTVEYTYDALDRRSTMKANGATPVSYGYDAASRLIQVAQAGLVVGLGYDNANRRTSLTYPNGTNTSYAYDNASRLTAITHNGPSGLIESLSYVYDAAGNRISLTRTNGAASNLPAAVQAAYDAANEQITFNSLPATFDANGNLTSQTDASGTTTFTYNARNQVIAINGPGLSASFTYDVLGRRITKTVNGVTTAYQYDRRDIIAEISGSAVVASYLRKLCLDEAFVRQSSSGNEYYHADALQSVLALTDTAGVTRTSYAYEPFGMTSLTGTSANPFQYTGRENDAPGLYYYRARYYTPQHQRFLSEDPIQFQGGLNFYEYAANNPLKLTDPLGLSPKPKCKCSARSGPDAGIEFDCDCQLPPYMVPDPLPCSLGWTCFVGCMGDFAKAGARFCPAICAAQIENPGCLLSCAASFAYAGTQVCRAQCCSFSP